MTEQKPIMGDEFLRRAAEAVVKKQVSIPVKEEEKESEEVRYKRLGREVHAKQDYITTVDAIANPPSVQAQRDKATEELKDERTRIHGELKDIQDRELTRLQDDATAAAQAAEEEKQKRIAAEQNFHTQQNQMLLDKLDELKKSNKPMEQQLDEYMAFADRIAEKMGYQKRDDKATDNPTLMLEIKKLELDAAVRDREWQYKIQQDGKEWDMKILKLQEEREDRKALVARDVKRDEMLASLPEAIGGALARGVIDSSRKGAPQQRPIGQAPQAIRIGEGESGTIGCPECESVIEVAPTTTVAQCLGCNTRYPVTRVPAGEPQPTEEE